MQQNAQPSMDLNNSDNQGRTDYSMWIVFGVFLVVFVVGIVLLYFWWLGPWLSGVSNTEQAEPVIPGVEETDEDGDGLSLKEESGLGTSDNLKDSDDDGLDDDIELRLGTDPTNRDTDGDGYFDKVELDAGYDPLS